MNLSQVKFSIQPAFSTITRAMMLAVLSVALPVTLRAQTDWLANVGAETNNQAKQANAFLPNEFWIHAGDSITWTFTPMNEIHTVTFPAPGQVRGSDCSPAPSGTSFDGSTCVNSAPMSNRAMYTVTFPKAGNYKLVCLIHPDMNGAIHVLPLAAKLPHDQDFYDDQARDQAKDILNDADGAIEETTDFPHSEHAVLMHGELAGTAGGRQYLAILRFLPGTIHVHVGQTVEWMNADPTEPHTVTFGPASFAPKNVILAADGALEATISSTSANVSSGILRAAPQDRNGLATSPLGTTRIRITFTQPGTYPYICSIHAPDGMAGTVVVQP